MRANVGAEKEKWLLVSAAPAQILDTVGSHIVSRMQIFGLVPRACQKGVASQSMLKIIGILPPGLHSEEGDVVVNVFQPLRMASREMDVTVMQDDIVESQFAALGACMHFSYALAVVAVLRKNGRKGVPVIPWDTVLVADPAAFHWRHACKERGSGGDARRACGKGTGEIYPAKGYLVQMRSFQDRMSAHLKAVTPPLINADEDDIGFLQTLLTCQYIFQHENYNPMIMVIKNTDFRELTLAKLTSF